MEWRENQIPVYSKKPIVRIRFCNGKKSSRNRESGLIFDFFPMHDLEKACLGKSGNETRTGD